MSRARDAIADAAAGAMPARGRFRFGFWFSSVQIMPLFIPILFICPGPHPKTAVRTTERQFTFPRTLIRRQEVMRHYGVHVRITKRKRICRTPGRGALCDDEYYPRHVAHLASACRDFDHQRGFGLCAGQRGYGGVFYKNFCPADRHANPKHTPAKLTQGGSAIPGLFTSIRPCFHAPLSAFCLDLGQPETQAYDAKTDQR